ncbi:cell envelope biogenesis protein OmpA [Peteryoungia desertarenae]|uniref:cell envelope biogenesis protein OmpA n=1 Tax=Peteryoungia desertarenae TaxID=1813451 RepID=UPI001FE411D7|nr:cell envelope biogenesis protein OmpA [Peteryoungia desertarenae]
MFETAFTLGLTQFARTFSFPERIQHRTARNAALELLRLRNTGFDAMFYDVKSLTAEETFYISDCLGSEGLIIIVPPTGGGMLTLCESVGEFRLRGSKNVHALAVAGIGGSALGAAAFARNVADAIKAPVAAVVSGYGLGDIVNEAIGGAFFFGWLGQMRNSLEAIDDAVGRPKLGAYAKREKRTNEPARTGLDADTVETLLSDPSLSFTLLTGHSRGNRVLADALYAMKAENADKLKALTKSARVVTFGGRIKMPEVFTDVIDVVGELDWYGEINSRPQIPSDVRVPYCGHSTNTDLAGALRVTSILKDILAKGPEAKPKTKPEVATADKAAASEPAATEEAIADAENQVAEPLGVSAPSMVPEEKTVTETMVKEAVADAGKAPEELETRLSESAALIAESATAPEIQEQKKPPETKPTPKMESVLAEVTPATAEKQPRKASTPARVTSIASVAGKKGKTPPRKGKT